MHPKQDVRIVVVALTGLGLALGSTRAPAQTLGTAFTYQGRLNDAGAPGSGSFDFEFRLFDAASVGAQIGSPVSAPAVAVATGLFTVSLDFGPSAFGPTARWLEIAVRPAGGGAYTTLLPRQRLTPTPGALFSSVAPWSGLTSMPAGFADGVDDDALGGLTCTSGQIAKWNGASWTCAADADSPDWGLAGNAGTNPATNFIGTTDNVPLELRVNNQRVLRIERVTVTLGHFLGNNILGGDAGNAITSGVTLATIAGGGGVASGLPSPNRVTDIGGTVGGGSGNLAGSDDAFRDNARFATVAGGYANTASGFLSTVAGGVNNQAGGAYSLAAGQQAIVRDAAASGDFDGDQGTFVWADSQATSFTSTGPNQFLIRAAGGVGVNTNSPSSALDVSGSIKGTSTSANGVEGSSTNHGSGGVYGRALATSGFSIGVRGDTNSPDGIAVWGYSTPAAAAGFPIGVEGRSDSPIGVGVNGFAAAETGVNYAIRGATNSPQGWAGYFIGNVHVTGALSKGGGSFKIDHPLDPENKYLYHSFVESPDMMNIYNGNVTTDEEGYTTVELPEWFEALNRDFRYQLTVVEEGDTAEFVHAKVVGGGVRSNRFEIRTSAPRTTVSWQVTGIRKDAFAEKHRIPVEQDKPQAERGRCLYPDACGGPEEKGIEYQERTSQARPVSRQVNEGRGRRQPWHGARGTLGSWRASGRSSASS